MIAYFDLYSGASGDMILAALLDAGLQLSSLQEGLASLPLDGYSITTEPVRRGALGATAFRIETSHVQPARRLADILALIDASGLPERVRDRASRVFTTLGQAEARVHRVAVEEVHFHEVGAVDSLVDIIGTCLGLELLGVDEVYASAFPIASGSLQVAHGHLPMPGPATLEILSAASAPIVAPPSDVHTELVTPTGAALLCTLARFRQPTMTLQRVGYGAGAADLPHPNILRVWLGVREKTDEEQGPGSDNLVVLETNIDDMNPQVYGYLSERLFTSGALDVYWTSIGMKKNRPGTMLSVLCRRIDAATLQEMLLLETTTMGVRVQSIVRITAERRVASVETPLGSVRVKLKWLDGRAVAAMPEYEDCVRLARRHDRPLVEVQELARRHATKLLE
jgi:pyridinium-3,5-bisthiocarboxylic acid mononucleotide nickel chelatase